MSTVDTLQGLMAMHTREYDKLPGVRFKPYTPHVFCKDGEHLSVQASKTHYCTPRDDYGPYTHVEIGFPSVWDDDLFGEQYDDVAGNVDIAHVACYIDKHGGIDWEKTIQHIRDVET